MLTTFLALLLFAPAPTVDSFKKEMAPLQSAVDTLVSSTGAQVMQRSQAAYIEGYGIVIQLELAFETPQGIFSTPKPIKEIRTLVAQRRKDLQEKLTVFMKQRTAMTDSIGPMDSLTVVVHVFNTYPADIRDLPVQILITAKKESSQQPVYREF
jgi:hypothetical protein